MRCKTCDYSLWGITGRTCPECGNPFKPSDFRFYPDTVRFRCPHCRQEYYGTTELGHLDPSEFDCVSCGAHIHMDEMVLEPREGVKDERTRPDRNPWLQRPPLTLRKAYWRTVGRAIGYPTRLARGTPQESSTASAVVFFLIHLIWIAILSAAPFAIMFFAFMPSFGHRSALPVLAPLVMIFLAPSVYLFTALFLWSFVTHLVLRPLSGRRIRYGATLKAIAYASPPLLLMAIPCLGLYGSVLVLPWWMINGIAMLSAIHNVRWWRAAIAHILGAVIALGMPIAGVWMLAKNSVAFTATSSGGPTAAQDFVGVLDQVRRPGAPQHVVELFENQPWYARSIDDIAITTVSTPDIMVGQYDLNNFLSVPDTIRNPMMADLRAAISPDGIHRLGHIVVCEHGVDLYHPQFPDVWLAIVWPDPDSAAAFLPPHTVTVILVQGMTRDIPLAQFPAELAAQNTLRQSVNLPVIPDPATIHMWPPGSQYGPAPSPSPQLAPVP